MIEYIRGSDNINESTIGDGSIYAILISIILATGISFACAGNVMSHPKPLRYSDGSIKVFRNGHTIPKNYIPIKQQYKNMKANDLKHKINRNQNRMRTHKSQIMNEITKNQYYEKQLKQIKH